MGKNGYHNTKNEFTKISNASQKSGIDDSKVVEKAGHILVGIYMFKVNNRNTRTRYENCSKLTIKIPERRHWHRSDVCIVNFGHISHLGLVFLLLTLSW